MCPSPVLFDMLFPISLNFTVCICLLTSTMDKAIWTLKDHWKSFLLTLNSTQMSLRNVSVSVIVCRKNSQLTVKCHMSLFILAIEVEMRIAYPKQEPCPHQWKAPMTASFLRPATRPAPEMKNCYRRCLVQTPLLFSSQWQGLLCSHNFVLAFTSLYILLHCHCYYKVPAAGGLQSLDSGSSLFLFLSLMGFC